MARISIIIPCYFNEYNLGITLPTLFDLEKEFPAGTEIEYVLVDDGSKDHTLTEILKFKSQFPQKIKAIKLAGNVGSYNAILAGMNYATGDCNVILAADLQDPPELIPKMFAYWNQGIKLVIANRSSREDSLIQKVLSGIYHFLIRKLALSQIPGGGYDLVLFDKKLREEVVKMNEKNTNVIYLLSWLNYDYVNIPYTRVKRQVGKSRWTLKGKIKLFIDSFVSFSFFPIRLISLAGILLGIGALLYGLFIIAAKVGGIVPIKGWTSLMTVLLFVSSFQMISLGIIGEYVWRSLDAARKRPNFIVEEVWL